MTSHLPMKALVFLILVSVLYFLSNNTPSSFLSKDNQPTKLLHDLFITLDIKIDKNATLKEYNDLAQANFLRPEERWNMPKKFEEKRKPILDILKHAGWINALQPTKKEYDYVIIFGATVERMKNRIQYLIDLQKKGLHFKKVVFLSGIRPLDPKVEPKSFWPTNITSIPNTEIEAAKLLWETTVKDNPKLKSIPIDFISSEELNYSKGRKGRPTTADTIHKWVDSKPEIGSILAISNQPYCAFQYVTLLGILQKRLSSIDKDTIEVVGPQSFKSTTVSVHLDNLARYLYTVYHNELRAN